VGVGLRRFGSADVPFGADIAGGAKLVAAPPDRSQRPWLVTFSSSGPFHIC
jgi:hypothetical protein